jgi:hypothetical protein
LPGALLSNNQRWVSLPPAEVPGRQSGAAVIAAGEDQAGPLSVQIGRARQEAVGAVGVAVAPDLGHLLDRGSVGARIARGRVGGAGQGLARQAVEHGQVFGTFEDAALDAGHLRAVGQDGGAGPVGLGPFTAALAPVDVRVAEHLAGPVRRAVAGAHGHLGLAVAVQVIDLELGVVRAGPDVVAQVDAPQSPALQRVGVDEHVAGIAAEGVVLGVGRVPLEDDLVAAVAVQVADAGVVGGVGIGLAAGRDAVGRWLEGDAQIAVGPDLGRLAGRAFLAADHGADSVGGGRIAGLVDEIGGAGQGRGVQLRPVSIEVEGGLDRIVAQQPPTDQHATAVDGRHGDQASVESLHLAGPRER